MPDRGAPLRFDLDGGVARLTLDRPDIGNTIDARLARALFDAANRCGEDPRVRAVLLAGAGPMFCAGGDLLCFAAAGDDLPRLLKEVTTYLHAAVSRFARMPAPLVVAVQGSAAGGGLGLVCAADLVLAADTARFTMAYTKIGLSPDGGSSFSLPRLIGLGRALDLALTNRVLTAREAFEWGIVTRVVPEAELAREAGALAAALAAGPTLALGAAKRLLRLGGVAGLETQMEHETQAIADAARTADGREGIAAFLEKRTPRFRGS